jgi:NitT/TauT family transport system substrate-binding protein
VDLQATLSWGTREIASALGGAAGSLTTHSDVGYRLFAQAGIDPASIRCAEMGNSWGQWLAQGKGDAALSGEGLRAQWRGPGLDFEYLLGREFSKFPANGVIIPRADFEDPAKKELYETYLRGWAMGFEFGHQNPRAATHIVTTQFPGLQQLSPEGATESLMELANVFRGDLPNSKVGAGTTSRPGDCS